MDKSNLTFEYDREGDILYMQTCEPYADQDSDEIGDGVVARFNKKTGEIESFEILSFLSRFDTTKNWSEFSIPVTAHFRENSVEVA
jgi:uncharacterized protein YuzE